MVCSLARTWRFSMDTALGAPAAYVALFRSKISWGRSRFQSNPVSNDSSLGRSRKPFDIQTWSDLAKFHSFVSALEPLVWLVKAFLVWYRGCLNLVVLHFWWNNLLWAFLFSIGKSISCYLGSLADLPQVILVGYRFRELAFPWIVIHGIVVTSFSSNVKRFRDNKNSYLIKLVRFFSWSSTSSRGL